MIPRAVMVRHRPSWWRRCMGSIYTFRTSVPVEPGDENTYLGGHHCKRCGRGNARGACDLPGGFTTPAVKMRASCGCLVLYCTNCMNDTWITTRTNKGLPMKGKQRDIYWWHEGYGKSHTRTGECYYIQGNPSYPAWRS